MERDPLGKALLRYFETGEEQLIQVLSKDFSPDVYKASYFLRSFTEMPVQEQKALALCCGKILDAGAGSGSHSLWLQQKGFDVTAIDTSAGCVQTMKLRGIKNAFKQSIEKHEGKYDTILMMMNGIGLCGKLKNLLQFLQHLKSMLLPGGIVLADSSDLFHLFVDLDSDEQLGFHKDYLGEVDFQFVYENERSKWFHWLYLDHKTFEQYATEAGFEFDVLYMQKDSSYLARLSLR
ncbi:methyltransferase domain-containing protein [bacterium]|nr:methyltransferase domain-containing protein [bacterium]